jgi:hypothetical protein
MFKFRFEHVDSGNVTFSTLEADGKIVQYVSPDGHFLQVNRVSNVEPRFYLTGIKAEHAAVILQTGEDEQKQGHKADQAVPPAELADTIMATLEPSAEQIDLQKRLDELNNQLDLVCLDDKTDAFCAVVGELFFAKRALEARINTTKKAAAQANELLALPAFERYVFQANQPNVFVFGVWISCANGLDEASDYMVLARKGDSDIGLRGRRFSFLGTKLLSWQQNEQFYEFSIAGYREMWHRLDMFDAVTFTKYCVILKHDQDIFVVQFELSRRRPRAEDLRLFHYKPGEGFVQRKSSLERAIGVPESDLTPKHALFGHFGPLTLEDLAKGSVPEAWGLNLNLQSRTFPLQIEMYWVPKK